MKERKRRRTKPNHEANAKIFPEHNSLLWIDDYEEYEKRWTDYRETGLWFDHDEESELIKFWSLLDCLFDLPDKTTETDFKKIAFSKQTFLALQEMKEIYNFFAVLNRSIDFPTITSKKIDTLLVQKKRKEEKRNLLTDEQNAFFQDLINDSEFWSLSVTKSANLRADVANMYLTVQSQIDEFGEVTNQGKSLLRELKSLREGFKRPRIYSESALTMMLAEFFEDTNKFGLKATIQVDPTSMTKEEYKEFPEYDDSGNLIPFAPRYCSQFFDFLDEYLRLFNISDFKVGNAQKLLRNRSKSNHRRILNLCGWRKSPVNLAKIFEILDELKP